MFKGHSVAKWFLLAVITGTVLPLSACGIDVYSMLYKYMINTLSDTLTGSVAA